MSRWTHPVCDGCYQILEPGREPIKIEPEHREQEVCCYCGSIDWDGIYYRYDPQKMMHCQHKE